MVKPPLWWGRMWAVIGVGLFVFVLCAIVVQALALPIHRIASECSLG